MFSQDKEKDISSFKETSRHGRQAWKNINLSPVWVAKKDLVSNIKKTNK